MRPVMIWFGWLHVFPRCPFPMLVHWIYIFPRFPLTCFPGLTLNTYFSRAFHWLHIFPRFPLVTYFPALSTGYIFSCAFHSLHVFPRFPLPTCFPALSSGYIFSRALPPGAILWLVRDAVFEPGLLVLVLHQSWENRSSLLSCFLAKLATS